MQVESRKPRRIVESAWDPILSGDFQERTTKNGTNMKQTAKKNATPHTGGLGGGKVQSLAVAKKGSSGKKSSGESKERKSEGTDLEQWLCMKFEDIRKVQSC